MVLSREWISDGLNQGIFGSASQERMVRSKLATAKLVLMMVLLFV